MKSNKANIRLRNKSHFIIDGKLPECQSVKNKVLFEKLYTVFVFSDTHH